MRFHLVIDFQHIYYKYFFQKKAGKLSKLSTALMWNGSVIEKDISLMYYPMRDIELFRKNLEQQGHEIVMSICFDSKSMRHEGDTEGSKDYKSGRPKSLGDEDYKMIEYIKELLTKAGHNTYKIEGYEADDLVNYISQTYKDKFDYTMIYTNDKDLLVNICDKIGVMRYKATVGYSHVSKSNYETYLNSEFGTFIPYNAIGLYLSTVGDSADKIKGINKFGKVKFSKLIAKIAQKNKIDWASCGDYNKLAEVADMCKEFLTDEEFEQLKQSFVLVANLEIDPDLISEPTSVSTPAKRSEAYSPLNMVSLIN